MVNTRNKRNNKKDVKSDEDELGVQSKSKKDVSTTLESIDSNTEKEKTDIESSDKEEEVNQLEEKEINKSLESIEKAKTDNESSDKEDHQETQLKDTVDEISKSLESSDDEKSNDNDTENESVPEEKNENEDENTKDFENLKSNDEKEKDSEKLNSDDEKEKSSQQKKKKVQRKNSSKESSPENEDPKDDKEKQVEDDEGNKAAAAPTGIRLVPLNLLLRQDILNKQDSKKPTRRSAARARKTASFIEISSEESESDEQISISSTTTSESSKSDSEDEKCSNKKSSKRNEKNNSTKNKLSNGTSKNLLFKEPMSPTKLMKKAKNVSINLERMPENVNKLMKCYKVKENTNANRILRIESWSETDDFENMIETSKIDRVALDKSKQDSNKSDSEESRHEKSPRKINGRSKEKSISKKKEKQSVAPSRAKSTRNAAQNRKKIIEDETSSSEKGSSSDDDDEDVPLTKSKTTKSKNQSEETESELDKSKVKNSEDSETDTNKRKKEKMKDDHAKEKSRSEKRIESSSDEEEKEKEAYSRATRSVRLKNQTKSKKSNSDSSEKPITSRKENNTDLKITINLNKNKVINHSKEAKDSDESADSDSDISTTTTKHKKKEKHKEKSESSDESLLQKLKVRKSNASTSSDENSSSKEDKARKKKNDSDDELPDEDKSPVCEQKLRNRSKFERNKDFNKLKELINVRKNKTKQKSDDESTTKDKASIKKENKENNDDRKTTTSGEKSSKRKRLLSSSEEEKDNDSKSKSNGKENPAKKKKKMNQDSDYENSNSDGSLRDEKEENSDASDSSDDNIRKRKPKRSSDDDDDDEEDLDELEKGRGKNKRRKRIKKMASSDEEGSDGEKKTKSGRKTIRKILRADKLDISTKEAAKIERERKQRIEDRQQMYNQFYDERPEELKEITQLVLDFDEETKEPLLQVDKKLVKKLKPHQANGVKFMWDACFESLERCENDPGSGCILAHCMGLGKTLQVITLVHTLINNSDRTNVTRALVVCPLNTVLNWVSEFNKWLKGIKGSEDVFVYDITKLKQNHDRANKLMEWYNEGGVMIMSYDMFRNLTNDTNNRLRKKIKESLQTSLIDPGPDLTICDEGHLLKNEKTSISKAMMKLRTLRRIVLTGTPIQNNMKEYFCMVQFVKPNLLGKYQEYMNRFVNPITNGQYTDSTEYDIQVMRRRAHVLHKLLDGCVQRRDYSVLAPFLPPKYEYILSIKLSPMQIELYKYYMENKARQGDDNTRKGSILFQDFQNLQRIWSAPKALRYNSDRYEIEMQRRRDLESEEESEGSIKDFIDDSESAVSTSSSDEETDNDGESIHSKEEKKKKKKKKDKVVALPRRTRAMAAALPSDHEEEDQPILNKIENPTEWWMQICPEEELNNIEHSSKLMLLMSILEKCEAIGDKLLVFSQSLYSLDVIEHFLNYIDEQTQINVESATFTGSWTLGQDYFRLDGSTPVEQRNSACKHFNSPDNPRARLFLISTRAGGLGINLVAANRVVIFDVSWNPSHDIQSIFRVYRFGQTKPCYVYRFLALGTMEEKIYERQVTKQAISKRVIDEQQIDRHYNQNDLQELYKYDLEPDEDIKEIPILPKDRLFAEMLKKYEDVLYKYHEHDTLLENKEEETLDEEERKQAWEEFEAEKKRPQYVPYMPQLQQQQRTGPVTSNNIFGIRTDILLKLLSMKTRLDNPTISDAMIKHAIPVLMQELYRQMDRGEMTLYQQLLALSTSLEVPQNYGGRFQVNESLMRQTYNTINSLPSTSSSQASTLYRQQIADRQQNLRAQLQRQLPAPMNSSRSPPRIIGNVIEID